MKTLFTTISTALLLSLLPTAAKEKKLSLAEEFENKQDVVYKTVDQRPMALDIFYPASGTQTPCPTIIYTHGGGWAVGSKRAASSGGFAPLFRELLSEGFCIVSVDYRLYGKKNTVRIRDCVIDAKDAVRYLVKNSQELAIDPEKLFSFGDSAGGQLAQMLLLSPSNTLTGAEELAQVSYTLAAGLSWYGPCDFEDSQLFNHNDRANFRDRFGPRIINKGVSPEEKQRLYREMSPITYLTKESPPLLMIQGDQDTTIPVKHAYAMQKRAKELEALVEILIIKNAGHNWRKADPEVAITPTRNDIIQASKKFFLEHLKS